MISMVYLYYDNPQMLGMQIGCWNTYYRKFKQSPEVLLVDDGSPNTPAIQVIKQTRCKIPIKAFRIKEDIPWNFAGARNLGCLSAEDWIYVSDIDTLLEAEQAVSFFKKSILDPKKFYMPRRAWLPGQVEGCPPLVNLLFHKSKFTEIGGYDEDYAGHYGREETDFYHRLRRVAKQVNRTDVTILSVHPILIADARTITHRKRDKTWNAKVYETKQAAGFPKPKNPLRFSWKRVL